MDELAKRFAELAEKYGPNVADAAMRAARMEAYSSMVSGALCLLVAAGMVLAGRWLWRLAHDDNSGWDEDWTIGACVLWGLAFFIAIPGIWSFIDPWVWATLSNPELWIAKKTFKL